MGDADPRSSENDSFERTAASTTIIDRASAEKHFGKVPPYSVVVSTRPHVWSASR
jgi:hypothetical protein